MTAGVPLLLVDGHNLLFRACFGPPAQIMSRDPQDKRDLTTQFMFFALLRKGINGELGHWPEAIVVFDGQHGAAHRQNTDPGYKATRPATAQALRPILALPDVKTGLTMYGITWIEIQDAEADDVIATLAAADPAREVLIASTDQDYYQLLRDSGPGRGGVRVFNTAMRPGHRFIGTAQMTALYHVSPRQYPDLRALCGDSSDNIPGIKGIGAKTAATLLSGGLTLDDLPASGRLVGGLSRRGPGGRRTSSVSPSTQRGVRVRVELIPSGSRRGPREHSRSGVRRAPPPPPAGLAVNTVGCQLSFPCIAVGLMTAEQDRAVLVAVRLRLPWG